MGRWAGAGLLGHSDPRRSIAQVAVAWDPRPPPWHDRNPPRWRGRHNERLDVNVGVGGIHRDD